MPEIPRLTSDPAPGAPSLISEQFGSGAGSFAKGEGLEVVGAVADQIGQAMIEARSRRALAQASTELQDFAFELDADQDQDFDTYVQRFREKRQEISNRISQEMGGSIYASPFKTRLFEHSDAIEIGVRQRALHGQRGEIRGDLAETKQLAKKGIRQAFSQTERDDFVALYREAILDTRKKGGITDEQEARELAELDEFLLQEGRELEAQVAEDRIFEQFDKPSEREAAARKSPSAIRDDVVRRVEHRNDRERVAGERAEKDTYDATINGILDGQITTLEGIQDSGLEGNAALQAWNALRAKTVQASPKTDLTYYSELLGRARMDPGKFSRETLDRTKLSDNDWKRFTDRQNKITTGEDFRLGKMAVSEFESEVRLVAHAQRWDIGEKGNDSARFNRFREAMWDRAESKGAEFDRDQFLELKDSLLLEVTTDPDLFFDDRTARFDVENPELEVTIPKEYLPQIQAELTRKGQPFTTENVQKLYRRALKLGLIQTEGKP